jgi:hypothetical protein
VVGPDVEQALRDLERVLAEHRRGELVSPQSIAREPCVVHSRVARYRRAALSAGAAAGVLCVVGGLYAVAQDAAPATEPPAPPAAPAETPPPVTTGPEREIPAINVNSPKRTAAKPAGQKPGRPPQNRTPVQAQNQVQSQTASDEGPTANPTAFEKTTLSLNAARENLQPKIGASTYTMNREAIESLPQGDNTPADKVILQMPGVSYDSAASNPSYHVRNEYANTQTRINGILLPEGVSGLGPILESSFVGSLTLLTGTLPAQYGLRTAGVFDMTTRSFFNNGGSVSLYGGSHDTFTQSFNYGGVVNDTQYFVAGRNLSNAVGIENPTAGYNAIHDNTEQGKFFGYMSTLLDPSTRLSIISGASIAKFQIPNNPGQAPTGDYGSPTFPSSALNEREYDRYYYNIVAVQTHGDSLDTQLSSFSRYAKVHFVPDVYGDLIFNDVAADVTRESLLNGIQFDAAYQLDDRHKLRAGFAVSAETTAVANIQTVLPVTPSGTVLPSPFNVEQRNSLIGWNVGGYIQDEWKITDQFVLNTGLRFDQLDQYVNANQFSPRVGFVYKPFEEATTIHAGYARYFTPPMQAQATPANLALVMNTTAQPEVLMADKVLPERSHYFDVGLDQKVLPGLTVGVDTYYKIATDQIDDGQFGQAVILTQFNYAKGTSEGIEFKAKYQNGDFNAYGNLSANVNRSIDVVSNQYLIDALTYGYLLNNWHYIDDMQYMTGSAGASYRWQKATLFSFDMIYGSGLRADFGNTGHVPPYTQFNVGVAHDFYLAPGMKATVLRFDVVNLFDTVYELRNGTGIGVFAPQYGPRRGFFAGLTQKL